MRRFIILLIFLILNFHGCVSNEKKPIVLTSQHHTAMHQYEIKIIDSEGKPCNGVTIKYLLKDKGATVRERTVITGPKGILEERLNLSSNNRSFSTALEYTISKKGFYTQTGELKCNGNEYINPAEKKVILFIRPSDYFEKNFALNIKDTKLESQLFKIIELVKKQIDANLFETYLEAQSIKFTQVKGKKYLQFKFIESCVYNSLQVNKYDICKLFFDNKIRSLITIANQYIGNSNEFYGFDFLVTGHTQNFKKSNELKKAVVYNNFLTDNHINEMTTEKVQFRFLIPNDIIQKYKNKDISGQKLLDSSILLKDDDRIELDLQ